MKKMFTNCLFVLALISMNGFIGSAVLAGNSVSANSTTLSVGTITGETVFCEGYVGAIYRTEEGMDNYSWSVTSGGEIIDGWNTNTISVIWRNAGDQLVAVNYEDPNGIGLGISAELQVRVTAVPETPGPLTGTIRVCQGDDGIEYSVPEILNATGYVWLIPDGSTIISGTNTNSIKLNYSMNAASGNVAVYGTNFCGDGMVSDFFPVLVNPIPTTPSIALLGDLLISSAIDGNQWYNNGVEISGATRQELEVTEEGRYYTVVTLGGCSSAVSNKIDITDLTTGIEAKNESEFQIYPVPNNGQFTIRLNENTTKGLSVKIYNNLGIIVYERKEMTWDANSSCFVDLQPLSTGTYAIVVENDNMHMMKKILIKK